MTEPLEPLVSTATSARRRTAAASDLACETTAAAPQVFLPGDVLPPNVAVMNMDGVLYGPAPGWVVSVPGVAVPIPTVAEVEALVERELNDREAA